MAFADRSAVTADPDFVNVPVEKLLSSEYAAERRKQINLHQAQTWSQGLASAESANTTHIMAAASVPLLLAGAARVLAPGGLLLLYGPFHGVGVPTAPSNAAFDAHLRSINPAMGLRDAGEVTEQARRMDLEPLADESMPANNRTLVFRKRGAKSI